MTEKCHHHAGKQSLEQLLAQAWDALALAGVKRTAPKTEIMRALIQLGRPVSADEIYAVVKEQKINRVTVYRNLIALEEYGIARRCDFGDAVMRFEFEGPSGDHHHHLICRGCRKIEKLDECELAFLDQLALKKGYTAIQHSLEFFGLCPQCQS